MQKFLILFLSGFFAGTLISQAAAPEFDVPFTAAEIAQKTCPAFGDGEPIDFFDSEGNVDFDVADAMLEEAGASEAERADILIQYEDEKPAEGESEDEEPEEKASNGDDYKGIVNYLIGLYGQVDQEMYDANQGKCGELNDGFFEKRDCTREGFLITEITEPLGAPVNVEDSESKIINVYAGVCCLLPVISPEGKKGADGKTEAICEEERTIYTATFESCVENAVFCDQRQWIISRTGAGILKVFVKQFYMIMATMVGSTAVVTLVINGVRISVSGVTGDISEAKQKIFQAIGGIVILFLSGMILYTINPGFFS